ncbi:zf-HC2 domain-containing protein, partial [Mycobacterium kiyosense]|uniref:zf-HC2 domain-containing protein n=1 Tax=Mycobacterium kiyosense TaxID=2871094 RepID=UPI00222F96E3
MTSGRRPAMPFDAEPYGHAYAMWDAAYILGSLSHADRREFEAHIAGCSGLLHDQVTVSVTRPDWPV